MKDIYKQEIPLLMENFELLEQKFKPLILSNIAKINKMYDKNSRLEYQDLYQEARYALFKCIKQFDPSNGAHFAIYLKAAISNSLKSYCRNELPHRFVKDEEKSTPEKSHFKCKQVNVGSLEELPHYKT